MIKKIIVVAIIGLLLISGIIPFFSLTATETARAQETDSNYVYAADNDGYLKKITADGNTVEWTHKAPQKIESVKVVGDYIYISSVESVYKLRDSDGSVVWEYLAEDNTYDLVVDSNKDVYVGTLNNGLEKINGADGTNEWIYRGHSSRVLALGVDSNDDIYSGGFGTDVHKVDGTTGSQKWVYSGMSDNIYTIEVGSDDSVYAGSTGHNVDKIDSSDGSQIWRYNHVGGVRALEAKNGYVYAGSNDIYDTNALHKIDSSTRNLEWNYSVGVSFNDIVTDPSGYVYTGTGNQDVRKLQDSNGGHVWTYSNFDFVVITVDLKTIQTSTFTGKITDSDGNALENANATIEDSSGNIVFSGTTDVNGEIQTQLEDGDYKFIGNKENYYEDNITFSISGLDTSATLSLSSKPKLSGTVIDTESNPVSNVTVRILDNGTLFTETSTNFSGEFSVNVDNENYTVEFNKDTYYAYNTTVSVTGDTDMGDIELESKEYNLNLRVSPYMNHSQSQKYVVRFNDETITENVTVTSSNISLIKVDSNTLTLNATDVVSDTGEVNITATYKVDNITIQDSENVTVAPMEMEYIEILPPLYSTLTVVVDETIQYLALAVIAGIAIAGITNAFGGIGLIIISLIMGWIMDYIPLGVLLASLFGGIFIMMNTRMREYREV